MSLSIPAFRAERCVRYRYAYSACSRCVDVCPHEAIQFSGATQVNNDVNADHYDGVRIAPDVCQSCALCAAACPTEALAVKGVSAEELLRQAGKAVRFAVSCAPAAAAADAVVPCLGALNAAILAEFARRGIALVLRGSDHCVQCPHAAGGVPMIAAQRAAYADLRALAASAWAEPDWCDADEAAPIRDEDHNPARRALFRRAVAEVEAVVSGSNEQAAPPLKAIRAAAPFLPERKSLLNGLFPEGAEDVLRVPRQAAIAAEDWQVAHGCTHCEACARACPTGAIQLLESNTAWRLAILNDRCVACEVCAEVCQPGVLQHTAQETVIANKQKGRLLVAVEKSRCSRCGRVFVNEQGGQTCPICTGDDEDFAEIFG
ncbi:4Fe-4S binding protein [Ferrigenium sp. UT4]